MNLRPCLSLLSLQLLLAFPFMQNSFAQLAVSSNDNKAELIAGVNTLVRNPPPDTVSIVDMGATPPQLIAELNAPGGWSAPPQSVAVAPDESIALIVSSTRIDPNDPSRTIFNDEVTVVDLESSPPQVIDTVHAGERASGISINPAGTMALVANRANGTVSVFRISGKLVTRLGDVQVCDYCQPSLPVFTPDGSKALVTRNADHSISVLDIEGEDVIYNGIDISSNLGPYSIDITPDGHYAIAANIGNGPTGGVDTVSVIDLQLSPPRLVNAITVGIIPEGLALSPDGNYLAVPIMNGSNLPPDTPWFHDFGILKIYKRSGINLSLVAEAEIGHWCQGVVWSNDATKLAVQCSVEHELTLFDFNGDNLIRSGSIPVSGGPTGIRTAQEAR